MNKIDQAIEALRAVIEAEVSAAEKRGATQAVSGMLAKLQSDMGIEAPKKRGRKPKP